MRHAPFRLLRRQQKRTHHRRQGQRHDAGHHHGTGQGQGELAEQGAGQPAHQSNRRIYRRQRDGHGDHRSGDFTRADQCRHHRRFSLFNMAVHVFHHHDGIIDHQPDGQHHGQQSQQVDAEAEHQHQTGSTQHRQRNRHHRNQDRAQRSQTQINHQHHDQQGFDQRMRDFIDRGLNEPCGFKRQFDMHTGRQGLPYRRQQFADTVHNHQRIAGRRREQADVHRRLAIHLCAGFGGRCRQFYGADIFHAHQTIAIIAQHQIAKFFDAGEVGIDADVGHHKHALELAGRCLIIVLSHRLRHIGGGQATPGQLGRIQPQAHRQPLTAKHLDRGYAVDGGKHRFHHACQIIAQCRGRHGIAGKADIRHRGRLARRTGDDRIVSLLRQLVAHLIDLRHDFRQRLRRIAIQFHAGGNHAAPLHR